MLTTAPWYTRSDSPLLVGHLMASAPPRSRAANAGSSALSILLHASLLTLAVALTSGPAGRSLTAPPAELYLPVEPLPEPVPPPPPIAGAPGAAASASVALPGFQVLPPPTYIPTDIPPIRVGAVLNEADFGGVGAADGTAAGPARAGTPRQEVNIAEAPVFTPVAVAPELKNRAAVQRALASAYPAMLRDAGVGGRVLVWVLVDESGVAAKVLVRQSSGVPALDEAALTVARVMRFSPGINHDVAVKVWVAVPVVFRVGKE